MRAYTKDWGLRLGAVFLLALVHIGLWRPVRDVLTEHVVYPMATAIDTPRADRIGLGLEPRAVRAEVDGEVHRFHMPAGLSYLAVAAVLVVGWPRRFYWFWLWGGYLVLGVLTYGAFMLGVGWTSVGFSITAFAQVYLVPALGLGALVAASVPTWLRELEEGTDHM